MAQDKHKNCPAVVTYLSIMNPSTVWRSSVPENQPPGLKLITAFRPAMIIKDEKITAFKPGIFGMYKIKRSNKINLDMA